MFRAGGLAALVASVAAAGAAPTFVGTAMAAGPVSGAVVVPELASAPKSIAVHWAFDSEGKTLSDAPVASKDYSSAQGRSCGDTGSVPNNRFLESVGGGDAAADPKVVNGAAAQPCKLKWQAHLLQNGGHFCGATILSPRWVMSAAHCKFWKDGELGSITVAVGDHSLRAAESHQVVRAIKQVRIHPNFDKDTLSGDFMLLELAEELPFNECIGAACLPSAASTPGTQCLISGWGALEDEGEFPDVLQVATVKIVSDSACASKSGGVYTIDGLMMCAQGGSPGTGIRDACQGDSGGPLVCKDSSGKYALQGTTSFGDGCANPKFAGVYARTAAALDWIKATAGLQPGGADGNTVPIFGATPPVGATGLAVLAVAPDGSKTSLGVIALTSAPAKNRSGGGARPSRSWSLFVLAAAARLWVAAC